MVEKSVNTPSDRSLTSGTAMRPLVEILNNQLADTIDLRSQIRHADFNIHSPYGQVLRQLFEGLSQDLQKTADTIALAIRKRGGLAEGTVRLVAQETNLPKYPLEALDALDHLKVLLSNHSRYALDTRNNVKAAREIGDSEIENALIVILNSVESNLWFLEAYLEGIAVGNRAETLPHWTSVFDGSNRYRGADTAPGIDDKT